jgi:hypothetical protein
VNIPRGFESHRGSTEISVFFKSAALTIPQAQANMPRPISMARTTFSLEGRLILTIKMRGRSAHKISVTAKRANT